MTKIDFYVLANTSLKHRDMVVCKLTNKAYDKQHRIFIYTESKQHVVQFDDLLWTYSAGSFLPHEIDTASTLTDCPILIGSQTPPPEGYDVLINLTSEVPAFYSQFQRIAEFVAGDTNTRNLARERYRYYRDHGCELNSHDLA